MHLQTSPFSLLSSIYTSSSTSEKLKRTHTLSQAQAESLVLSFNTPTFPTTAIRTHAVIGPHDTNLITLLCTVPRTARLGNGSNLYDFTYAPNLALAHDLAARNLLATSASTAEAPPPESAAGKPFFVTNGEPRPFGSVLDMVYAAVDEEDRKAGSRVPTAATSTGPASIPVPVAYGLTWLVEKGSWMIGKKSSLFSTKKLGDAVSERWYNNAAAKRVLGYEPKISLEQGIKESVAAYKRSVAGNSKK